MCLSKLQQCVSSPPFGSGSIHSLAIITSHPVTGGRDGVKIWHVVFCLRIALIPQLSSSLTSPHTEDKYWTVRQNTVGKRARTHACSMHIETERGKSKLVTLQWARAHTPHTLVPWMKADIRPCLQQGEVGDILSEFFNTTNLTTPQAERVDSFSLYMLQLFFSPTCTHTHTYTRTHAKNPWPLWWEMEGWGRRWGCEVKRESCQKNASNTHLTGWKFRCSPSSCRQSTRGVHLNSSNSTSRAQIKAHSPHVCCLNSRCS